MKNKVTAFQVFCVFFFLTRSLFFINGYSGLVNIGAGNTIISVILGSGLGILFIKLYLKFIGINNSYSKYMKIIMIGLCSGLLFFIIKQYSNYIIFNYLPNTNPFLVGGSIILLIIYILKNNVDTLFRCSEIYFYIFSILFIISILGIFLYVDINNIKPVINSNYISVINTTLTYAVGSFINLYFLTNLNIDKKPNVIIKAYLLGSLSILIIYISIIGILSVNVAKIYTYPEIIILKKISFFNFIERIENILSMQYLFDGLILIIIIFYNIKLLLNSMINKKNTNYIIIALGGLILFLNNIINISNTCFYLLLIVVSIVIPLFNKIKKIILSQ